MSKKRFSMANPYRELSKVSPQKEDGYMQISNVIMEKLYSFPLSGDEVRACLFVIRKTWGFNKTYDIISYSQFADALHKKDRAVKRTVKRLCLMRLLVRKKSGRVTNGTPVNCYLFNKYWDTWTISPKKRVSKLSRVTKRVKNGCPNGHPQNTYTKDRGNFSPKEEEPEISLDPIIVAMQEKSKQTKQKED